MHCDDLWKDMASKCGHRIRFNKGFYIGISLGRRGIDGVYLRVWAWVSFVCYRSFTRQKGMGKVWERHGKARAHWIRSFGGIALSD